MAQFRATIQGQRGEASRLGSKKNGIQASVNGWNVGVYIDAIHINGVDVIRVYKTKGSNGGDSELLAELRDVEHEKKFNNPAFCKDCGIEFDLEIDNPLCLCNDCLKQHNESEG